MAYCDWDQVSDVTHRYHDEEWGVPVHDDIRQFEYLLMEVMQCGLSWNLMMKKREIFRQCFDDFNYEKVAKYGESDIHRILNTPGMIRSRPKIEAVISNAQRFIGIRKEYGTFCNYLWAYTNGKTILYERHGNGIIPASNGLSKKVSADLRKRGFKYLGPVVVYSHLQAAGLINDHDKRCPRYAIINASATTIRKRRDAEEGVVDFSDKGTMTI